ncbi:MAG: hypothetical protein KF726_05515 [Anaerolineae bacterium]|nr:hypothetical protein [Anaerolineae bacterium]
MHSQPQRQLRHLRLLIPLLLLIIAAIACDDYPTLPAVDMVMADKQPGRAYARVGNIVDMSTGTAAGTTYTTITYQTDDYGKTWRRVEDQRSIQFPVQSKQAYDLYLYGETLSDHSGRELWSFPRSGFRSFFHAESGGVTYQLPYGPVSNDASGDALYVAMGSEGVVVARFADETRTWESARWSLENSGIDAITPIGLTITDPAAILLVIIFAFVAPPLILIHQSLLKWVWTYVVKDWDADRWSLRTTLIIAGVAVIAIVIWLTDVNTDYYPILAVTTVIVAAFGVIAALLLTRQSASDVRLRVLIVTAVVSLVVPAALAVGTGAAMTSWPIVIVLVWGIYIYRRVYRLNYGLYLRQSGHPHPRWVIDRLTLETVFLGSLLVTVFLITLAYGNSILYSWFGSDMTNFVLLALGIFYAFFAIRALKWYIDGLATKLLEPDQSTENPPVRLTLVKWSEHVRSVALWWLGALIFAGATFFVQAVVYGWFQALAK